MRVTLFWGPYNKDPTTKGTILVSPIVGNSHLRFRASRSSPWWIQGLGFRGLQQKKTTRTRPLCSQDYIELRPRAKIMIEDLLTQT